MSVFDQRRPVPNTGAVWVDTLYRNLSPESSADMMVLQYSSIVVEQRRVWARHDVEVVSGAGVLVVMHQCCHQRGEDVQVW